MRELDEAAFEVVVSARTPTLRRTAYSLCGDWHLADDLVQKTLLKLFTAWPLRDAGAVDGWLTRTLVRTFIDQTRRSWWRREQPTAELPEVAAPTVEPADTAALLGYLAALPARQRACIVLRFLDDYSVEQTADVLACTPGTVRAHTSRGLASIRERLASDHPLLAERPTP